jgi:ribosome-binding ATPase YchF (GTP1/OBG family)
VEAELVELDQESRSEFLESLGVSLKDTGLRRLVKEAYDLLGLQTYYTSGPTETRAWTIRKGWTAPKAAGYVRQSVSTKYKSKSTLAADSNSTFLFSFFRETVV